MSAQPKLRVLVNPETGEINECPGCAQRDDIVAGMEHAIGKLEAENRALKRNKEAERNADPQRRQILELIERWKLAAGHPRANSDAADRFDVVKARLNEGYTIDQLELAIDGIGAFRFVVNGQRIRTGNRSQRHDRLGIALGGGEAVERFAILGWQARKERELAA